MAGFPLKFTAQRGKDRIQDITVANGSAEAQTDTISINMDITKMTRGEALQLIDYLQQAIHAAKWPAQ